MGEVRRGGEMVEGMRGRRAENIRPRAREFSFNGAWQEKALFIYITFISVGVNVIGVIFSDV